jgi:hypothetical protein
VDLESRLEVLSLKGPAPAGPFCFSFPLRAYVPRSTLPVVLSAAACILAACGSADPRAPEVSSQAAQQAGHWFADRTDESGLSFVHFNGRTGAFWYPEVMPPGVALLDYDNDGDLDVFVVQGRMLDGLPVERALVKPQGPPGARLFRNDLPVPDSGSRIPAREGTVFTDVTDASGIDARGYGMGAAAGDYDNDGCVDLYVTNLGANQLLKNNCDGTFSDATGTSRTADSGWSVPAAFVDVDRDGWLDLFVGHYLNYSVAGNVECSSLSGLADYCPPHVYRAQPSRLFRNNRDGTFSDRTAAAGLATEFGPALGVSSADFNNDGWIDIFVANDGVPNNLWINRGNGTFRNTALLAGAAVSPDGLAKASMGVDAGDFDNDGDEDLFIGELTGQGADLYVNDGSGMFTDESARSGLRLRTLPFTGFGTGWLDIDNDGLLDLAVVNGAVTHTAEALARNERFALQQRNQLFRNAGGARFEEVSDRGGPAFTVEEVSRGAAFGDLDNDGDTDLLVGNDGGPLRVLLNTVGDRAHWIGLRLVGTSGRDMLGARVAVMREDGGTVWRRVRTDGSYASANDPRVIAGLGDSQTPPTVRVQWPGGAAEEWTGLPVDRYSTLTEGTGRVSR